MEVEENDGVRREREMKMKMKMERREPDHGILVEYPIQPSISRDSYLDPTITTINTKY